MNPLELIRRCRDELDDTGSDVSTIPAGYTYYWEYDDSSCLWKNDELIGLLNRVLREISARRPIIDRNETSITQIQVSSGTAEYSISPLILFITRITLETSTLAKASRPWLDSFLGDWESLTGDPAYYLDNFHKHSLTLIPEPDSSGTMYLEVGRMTLDSAVWTSRSNELADFQDIHEPTILAGMRMYAYRKRDTDAGNINLAQLAENEFNRLAGNPRSLEHIFARRVNADRSSMITGTARAY